MTALQFFLTAAAAFAAGMLFARARCAVLVQLEKARADRRIAEQRAACLELAERFDRTVNDLCAIATEAQAALSRASRLPPG